MNETTTNSVTPACLRRSEAPASRRQARSNALRRMISCRAGATASELALIAFPFLAIVFMILNMTLVFFAQQTLQTATTQAARLIMTGQAQKQSMTAAQFKQQICTDGAALFNCANLYVNVQTFASFSAVTMNNPNQSGTFNSASFGYNVGSSGNIEVVQVFYQWPLFANLMGTQFSNMIGQNQLLVATAAFRNEPYLNQ